MGAGDIEMITKSLGGRNVQKSSIVQLSGVRQSDGQLEWECD